MLFKKKKSSISYIFSKKKESVFTGVFSKKTNVWSDVSNSVSDIAKQAVIATKKNNTTEQVKGFVSKGVKKTKNNAEAAYKKVNVSEHIKEVSDKASDFINNSSTKSKTKKATKYIKKTISSGANKAKSSDISGRTATALNQVLSTGVAKDVDRFFRESFTQGASGVYDKAMDSARQLSGEFGGNHRLFDGGHSLSGAWEKVTNALPDDSVFDEVKGYVSALAKDGFTPAGLPVMTFDRSNFTQIVENSGISREWIEDAVSVTGTELIGSSVAGVAAFLKWDKHDVSEFTKLASSMGVYSLASANPLLTITAISSLAYSWHVNEKENTTVMTDMTKGAIPAAAFVTVAGAVPGSVLFGLVAGAAISYVAKQGVDKHFDYKKV